MPQAHSLRALIPAALAAVAAVLAASCGGSFDSQGSSSGVQPGGQCAENGATAKAADGCNTCTCTDGNWGCTEMACPPAGTGGASSSDGGSAACDPGSKRMAGDGCNTCQCTSEGTWMCTRSACNICQPGETMNDGCNDCSCADGQWACTDRACPPPACSDGETTFDGCNTCSCSGGLWSCTKMACPPPACANGETMNDGCNTCSCFDGQWACTARACPPPECMSGDIKFDGCNRCQCESGYWMCDAAACPSVDAGPAPVGCGGWLGDTCTSDEYCAYEEGQLCGAADASATCQPRPQVCDTMYSPVCGCDGATYSNACGAASAGTGTLHAGPC